MSGGLPVLEKKEQLLELSLLIRRQEENAIHVIKFQSETERVKYLRTLRSNHESVEQLLASAEAARDEAGDETKKKIADDIYNYAVGKINISLQAVGNYCLRKDYLAKIKNHSEELIQALRELDPNDVEKAEELAKEAKQYKDAAKKFLRKYQSKKSLPFVNRLWRNKITFEELVTQYKQKLNYEGKFEHLKDTQKIKVYDAIVDDSGRGKLLGEVFDEVVGAAGAAALVFMLGAMVWDIYQSGHPIEKAAEDAATLAAGLAPGGLKAVFSAVATALPEEALITEVFVDLAGLMSGIGTAITIVTIAGTIVDFIFHHGGKKPPEHTVKNELCYVPRMPDGPALARQIAHRDNLPAEADSV